MDFFPWKEECGGIFMARESRLMPEKQKERYLKHNNSIQNEGYVAFLESFIKPVLSFVQSNCGVCVRYSSSEIISGLFCVSTLNSVISWL